MSLGKTWFGAVATGVGLVLIVLVLTIAHGAGEVAVGLGIAIPFTAVGVGTMALTWRTGRTPEAVMLWLGVAIVVGAAATLLPPFVLPDGRGWVDLLPLVYPSGLDFRVGLYDPAVLFASTNSAWPPLTLLLGRPFTLVSASSGYLIHVAILALLAIAVAVLSGALAVKAVVPPPNDGRQRRAFVVGVCVVMILWLVTSFGFLFEIERGNLDLYALFFSLVAVWLLLRLPGSAWRPALFLALAINLKIYPAVLLALLFWRYRWRAAIPVAVTNLALLLFAGPRNAWQFAANLKSLQGDPFFWPANHSAASYAHALRGTAGWLPPWLGYLLLFVTLTVWILTVFLLIRRGWSDSNAVLFAAASVPLMNCVPTVSHDYKLVLLVYPLAVLSAAVASMKSVSLTVWGILFWLLGFEMVFLARSTSLPMPAVVLQNKYPLVLLLQALLLTVVLVHGREDVNQGAESIGHSTLAEPMELPSALGTTDSLSRLLK